MNEGKQERIKVAIQEWNKIIGHLQGITEGWGKLNGLLSVTPIDGFPLAAQRVFASRAVFTDTARGVEKLFNMARLAGGLDNLLIRWEGAEDANARGISSGGNTGDAIGGPESNDRARGEAVHTGATEGNREGKSKSLPKGSTGG